MRARRRKLPIKFLIITLLPVFAALILLGKYGLSVTEYRLEFAKLPPGFEGFRIVQLSDLHGRSFGRDNSRLLEKVRQQSPEIIVLTGDFLNKLGSKKDPSELGSIFEDLCEIAPTYYVSGNHDWASGKISELAALLDSAGVRYLRNEYLLLERGGDTIALAGVEDPNGRADMMKPDELVALLRGEQGGVFTLLLGHRNYWLEKYPQLEVELILCGHSHGGIVRLPFVGGVFQSGGGLFPQYDAGLFKGEHYDMIVSRGLGDSFPVIRFLNTPEIVTVILHTME